ncbi:MULTISPECIES: tetratricopeptide repeat protein [Leisingera]|jgi:tetratricopeptide (TPR) repeat protein|uniref:Tetratricopeptide repeat protein 38 n=1 Tax=Leisingera aquaemixtae TaxID=1396826 RepID=A0ABY5WN70_9RHOB|nr:MULTISPECIES: tetratricopeptide repeat protein [Leisingera]QDI76136.1 tetratricopeptide repeat protein [Leisingera aquaemixtae]UWQ42814.1 tetratricopeptide repeat protein [Leisingera aquaemixtae]
MTQDIFGQDNSLTDATAQQNWNAVQLGVLSHAAVTADHLGAVLKAAPEFALAHAIKGLSLLMLGRSELVPTAREALRDARACCEGALPRERKYVDALDCWLAGRPSLAIQRMEEVLDVFPEDTLAMKLSHGIRFIMGDPAGMRASVERVLPAYAPDHAGRGYLLGCHSFALEETGEYERAANAGRQALWMAPDDAWGLHAVAHVHDMTGNARSGLDWLHGREEAWAHCNNFRYHVWWHKALMHLDLGQMEEAVTLYDTEVRKDKTDDYRDISNATSLLMRLELEGVDVGSRWDELANLCAARTEDGSLIFADLHYLLALTGHRKEDAHRLVQRIHADAERGGSEARARMADPGCAAADGLEAFGDGQYMAAFAHLSAARATLQLAGGSHAQRDVFERITIDAGIRSGQLDEVEAILDDRRARRGGAEDNYALARRTLISEARNPSGAKSVPAE